MEIKRDYDFIVRMKKKDTRKAEELFDIKYSRLARKFHREIPGYKVTPLRSLENLSNMIGLGGIYVKDEAQRLTLNSFKVMGGSFAIFRLIEKKLGLSDDQMSYEYLLSPECHEKIEASV